MTREWEQNERHISEGLFIYVWSSVDSDMSRAYLTDEEEGTSSIIIEPNGYLEGNLSRTITLVSRQTGSPQTI